MPPKVILQLYPVLPSDGEDGLRAAAARPRCRTHHRVLHDWLDIVKAADRMGVWGISTIEHHLHSEGYEVGPNPGVLNAWWAGHVKNAHVGALGYVMATQDPIRVAEETAILGHITEGKFFVGFARGYQSRWANILGQFTDTVATVSDGSAADHKNRDIFEERVAMVLKCWEEDSVTLDGNYYQAPYPLATGVEGYPASRIAQEAGAPGEIDAAGNVRRISVVPAPYRKTRPPIMVATSKSDSRCAIAPATASSRFISPNSTASSARARSMSTKPPTKANGSSSVSGRMSCAGFTFARVRPTTIASCATTTSISTRISTVRSSRSFRPTRTPTGFRTFPSLGIFIGGTLDQVRAEWQALYRQVPAEYITLIFHYAQQPKDDVLRELELFMTEVVPTLEAVGA